MLIQHELRSCLKLKLKMTIALNLNNGFYTCEVLDRMKEIWFEFRYFKNYTRSKKIRDLNLNFWFFIIASV